MSGILVNDSDSDDEIVYVGHLSSHVAEGPSGDGDDDDGGDNAAFSDDNSDVDGDVDGNGVGAGIGDGNGDGDGDIDGDGNGSGDGDADDADDQRVDSSDDESGGTSSSAYRDDSGSSSSLHSSHPSLPEPSLPGHLAGTGAKLDRPKRKKDSGSCLPSIPRDMVQDNSHAPILEEQLEAMTQSDRCKVLDQVGQQNKAPLQSKDISEWTDLMPEQRESIEQVKVGNWLPAVACHRTGISMTFVMRNGREVSCFILLRR